jgi:hypothetical protein
MSFDLAVWYPHEKLSAEAALRVYQNLCEGDVSGLKPHPAIEAFYEELTAKHPEIDDVPEDEIDNHDLCPWSIQHDRSDRHLIMCSVWSQAAYVEEMIHQLARKHGLVVFDPQSTTIAYPDGAPASNKPWWKFW